MPRVFQVVPLFLLASVLAACGVFEPKGSVCLTYASGPSVNVAVRDQGGRARALGATAKFYEDTVDVLSATTSDTLVIQGGSYGKTYDIHVSAPYYLDTVIRNVRTSPADGCGHAAGPPVTASAVLTLQAGAPAIRSLHLLGREWLDRSAPYDSVTYMAYLDANASVSNAVTWNMTGDTSAVTLDRALGMLTYHCAGKSTTLILKATLIADPTFTDSFAVVAQGHPANPTDPPCT